MCTNAAPEPLTYLPNVTPVGRVLAVQYTHSKFSLAHHDPSCHTLGSLLRGNQLNWNGRDTKRTVLEVVRISNTTTSTIAEKKQLAK